MKILDRLAKAIAGRIDAETRQAPLIIGNNTQPQYPDNTYRGLESEGYARNSIVFAGVDLLARSFASVPLKVYDRKGGEIKGHPMTKLWSWPNPSSSQFGFAELAMTYLILSGSSFMMKARTGRKVTELWNLRPDRMKIYPSRDNFIDHYGYVVDGQEYPIAREDIIHVKLPNPGTMQRDLYFGQSPLSTAIKPIGTDNEAFDYANTVFVNHGIPSTIIVGDQGVEWSDLLIRRFRTAWDNNCTGSNRGKPTFLQGVKEVVQLGYNLDQLAFSSLTSLNETRILSTLGVPPILVGAHSGLEYGTYANYETALLAFWSLTMFSHHQRFAEAFNNDNDLTPGDVAARFDYSNTPAMQKQEAEKADRARQDLAAGGITVNEYRERLGLEKDEKRGNVYLRAFSLQEVPFNEYEPEPEPIKPATDPNKPTGDEQPAQDEDTASPAPPSEGKSAPACSCGRNHAEGKREKMSGALRDALALIRHAQGRNAIADRYVEKLVKLLKKEGALESADVARIYDSVASGDALTLDQVQRIVEGVNNVKVKWSARLAEGSRPLFIDLATAAATHAGDMIGVAFNLDNSTTVSFLRDYSFKFADKYCKTSSEDVRDVLLRANTEGLTPQKTKLELIARMDKWSNAETAQSRAEMIARTEVIRCANAGAREAYRQGGIGKMQWLAVDDSCPYCIELNGKSIGIDECFAKMGDELAGKDAEGNHVSMPVTYEDIDYPPAHVNCRCCVIPDLTYLED